MTPLFRVRVAGQHLVFASAHFITFDGSRCEGIHGHNFRAAVEVEATLDTNHYVFDFIALKKRAKEITDALDHVVLLPTRNQHLVVQEAGPAVQVRHGQRAWVFPKEDCALLPIENTTAEMLALLIAQRLRDSLKTNHGFTPKRLRVEVEEGVEQWAAVELA